MEQIKEKHENPIIERVSDSLGVHQPENATETKGLASVAYLASWREIDKETFEEKGFEEEKQEWYEVSELPARLEYLRENAESYGYSLSDCRVSLAEYSKRELSEENISRIGTCVLFIRENEKFYYSTAEEAREAILRIFRKHRIPPTERNSVCDRRVLRYLFVVGRKWHFSMIVFPILNVQCNSTHTDLIERQILKRSQDAGFCMENFRDTESKRAHNAFNTSNSEN